MTITKKTKTLSPKQIYWEANGKMGETKEDVALKNRFDDDKNQMFS